MPSRLRLFDLMLSELPTVIGACASDTLRIGNAVNTAQRRLLYAAEAGDESWHGTFAEVAFNINPQSPFITLPRDIARIEALDVRKCPVPIHNQFYEYLQFGSGRMPKMFACERPVSLFSRNNFPTFTDLTNPPQILTFFITDPADAGKRILVQGLDANNNAFTSQDGFGRVTGQYVTFVSPFISMPFPINRLTALQKDITNGQIQIFQTDPNTGAQLLLSTMDPGEQVASYRRYFLDPLPCNPCVNPPCTNPPTAAIQATAIVKMDLIPVRVPTDFCLIGNVEAIIEEAQSARYSRIDETASKQMSLAHHRNAIRLLNGELSHFYGKNTPELNFRPFGSARLERVNISMT